MATTPEQLKATIKCLDPSLSEDSPEFGAALALLSAFLVGANNTFEIARLTGLPVTEIWWFGRNLRNHGVCTEDGRIVSDWGDKRGEFAFWRDVNVALGRSAQGAAG